MWHKTYKIFFLALLSSGVVLADGAFDNTRFYVGGELSLLNRTSYNDANSNDLNNFKTSDTAGKLAIQKNEMGINVFLGGRFSKSVGMEGGFSFIENAKADVQNGLVANNKVSNVYLDLLGYMAVSRCVDMVGLVGVGSLRSHADVPGANFINLNDLNQQKIGYRLGGGAQYYFMEDWSSRALIRYQSGNKQFLRSLWSISIGILYTF